MDKIRGTALHFVSCRWTLPDDRFNPEMVWWQTRDYNFSPSQRHTRLLSKADHPQRGYASYHWLITREGERWALVHPAWQAYHAGVSEWNGRESCNGFMLGIGLINDEFTDYTKEQYNECAILHSELIGTHGFGEDQIVGHEQIAPGRKKDPGSLWDWKRFHRLLDARLIL